MNESGFTLLEMLFVLMITVVLTFIVVPVVYDAYVETEENQFFSLFESDIRFIQNQALKGRELSIYLEHDRYIIQENKRTLIESRDYPKSFPSQRFTSSLIEFWNTGTVKNPRTYLFRNKHNQKYKVVFPFGKGRHYIEEF